VLADSHARIVETRTALEERNRALEEHLAGIAHDLRTPLASLVLSLEAVADEAAGPLHDEARRALSDAVYLSTLVDNLHQGARLRHAFDLTSGQVELTELVARLAQRFAIVGRHAGVEVASHAPDAPVWVACTPTLAERAIGNLVHNAVLHQRSEGHVAIVLQVDEAAGTFSLVVDDDGPGLPGDLLASLDIESFRTDAARQRGPGLGMVIAAEVARRAGWTLSWSPLAPRGTRARIAGRVAEPPGGQP
jgi:signal transduction histidine kinase